MWSVSPKFLSVCWPWSSLANPVLIWVLSCILSYYCQVCQCIFNWNERNMVRYQSVTNQRWQLILSALVVKVKFRVRTWRYILMSRIRAVTATINTTFTVGTWISMESRENWLKDSFGLSLLHINMISFSTFLIKFTAGPEIPWHVVLALDPKNVSPRHSLA